MFNLITWELVQPVSKGEFLSLGCFACLPSINNKASFGDPQQHPPFKNNNKTHFLVNILILLCDMHWRQQSTWNECLLQNQIPWAWGSEKAAAETWPDKELLVLTEHPLPASKKCFSFGGLEEWAPREGISLFKQNFIMPICYFTITLRQEPVIWVSHDAENSVKFISIKVSVLCCKNIRKINFLSQ